MPPLTFHDVCALGLKLPRAEAGTTYGSPALMVNGRMFACMAVNKSVEPDTLGVRVPFEQRDNLLTDAADIYYLTDHYVDYSIVLVRLSRIRRDALEALLEMAHRFVATETRQSRHAPRRTSPPRPRR